jgi:hypothetical protein
VDDDELPDQIEYDPRWEVQPEPDDEDDPGSSTRAALIACVAMTIFVALGVWLVLNTPPAS